jgi:hypothetical protein
LVRPIAQAEKADPERRCEEADPHREDHDHRIMHLVHPNQFGDREQEGPEEHDRRRPFEDAAEDDEGDDRRRGKRR